jgi:hypothetical protein
MRISASARDRSLFAVTGAKESGTAPITLSERSSTGLALIRIFVGYLWFQQLFWMQQRHCRRVVIIVEEWEALWSPKGLPVPYRRGTHPLSSP